MSKVTDPVILDRTGQDISAKLQKIADAIIGGTIDPITITANGTYTPTGLTAGYGPVTVNVGGVNRTLLAEWDFTGETPLIDTVGGYTLANYNDAVSFSSGGAYFTPNVNENQGLGSNQELMISLANLGISSLYGHDVEVDIGNFARVSRGSSNDIRFIKFHDNADYFFGIRQWDNMNTRGWMFYGRSGYSVLYDDTLKYDNCTLCLSLSGDNKDVDRAYVDGELIIAGATYPQGQSADQIGIGSKTVGGTSYCIGGMYVKALRVYRRESA